jgi:hypothetical protein
VRVNSGFLGIDDQPEGLVSNPLWLRLKAARRYLILNLFLGDPLTRPAPAGENAGGGPPSVAAATEGCKFKSTLASVAALAKSFGGADFHFCRLPLAF